VVRQQAEIPACASFGTVVVRSGWTGALLTPILQTSDVRVGSIGHSFLSAMRSIVAPLLPLLVLCSTAAGSQAQIGGAGGRDFAELQLDSVTSRLVRLGWTAEPLGTTVHGSLPAAADTVLHVEIGQHARWFLFVGVCDAGCSDLDLSVGRPDQYPLAVDHAPDDNPIVALRSLPPGSYPVTVSMANCAREACRFALRVFASGSQGPPNAKEALRAGGDLLGTQLDSLLAQLTRQQWRVQPVSGGPVRGTLPQGGERTIRYNVTGSPEQVVFGAACDADCHNLDLRVVGPAGQVVGASVFADSHPVVQLLRLPPGEYQVVVSMPGCDAAQCGYAVSMYATRPVQ
jgi:hypothetical protein